MSLVNDMLRDLDAQKTGQADQHLPSNGANVDKNGSTEAANDLLTQMHTNDASLGKGSGDGSQFWPVVSGFLVFFVILGTYYLWQFQDRDEAVEEVVEAPPKVFDEVLLSSEVTAVLDEASTQGKASTEAAAIATTQSAEDTTSASFQQEVVSELVSKKNQVVELVEVPEKPVVVANVENHIRALIDAGNNALKLDRLRTPKEDNAYDRFSAVLALQPDNPEALAGLEKIQNRYLGFIKSVINKGQYYKVPDLVKKARDVGVEQQDIDEMLASLSKRRSRPAQDVIKHLKEEKTAITAAAVVAGQVAQPKVVVERSFQSRDLAMAKQAANYIDEGRVLIAENQLKEFVQDNPKSVYALQKLFDLRMSQQRLQEAEALIDQASHLPGESFSYMVGQVLARRGDFQGSLRALNSHSPAMDKMPGYYALKAGVLHKQNENPQAIGIYQKLILQDKSNTAYWLGLAVSMDAIDAPQTLSVYQRVESLAPASANYLGYVRDRIQALTPDEAVSR